MTTPNSTISEQLKTIFTNQCSCSECSSGVSPISYFYDLLNYSYKNFSVKSGSGYISLGSLGDNTAPTFFRTRFKQEVENAPVNCEALNEKLCQVRMAVEALWRYREPGIGNNSSTNTNQTAILDSYMPAMHQLLLASLGLSTKDLSLIRLMSQAEKTKKANSLGFKYVKDSNGKDNFDYLNLDLAGTGDFDLTENTLETLFGIKETAQTRDPFSTGAKSQDTNNIVNRWVIENAILDENTDPDGFLHVTMTYTVAGTTHAVNIYKDSAKTMLVASGSITTGSTSGSVENTIRFYPVGNSGLSGYFLLKGFSASPQSCRISIIPRVLSWKIRYTLETWELQDQSDFTRTPFIEPDIMSLNDLQLYKIDESTAASALPNIYTTRLGQLNTKRTEIVTARTSKIDLETVSFPTAPSTVIFGIRQMKTDKTRIYMLNGLSTGDRIKVYDINGTSLSQVYTGIAVGSGANQISDTASDITVNDQNIFVCNRTATVSTVKVFAKTTTPTYNGMFNPLNIVSGSIFSISTTLLNRANTGPDNELYISYSNFNKILKLSNSKGFTHVTDILLQGSGTSVLTPYYTTYEVVPASNKLVKKDQQGNVIWEIGKRDAGNNFIAGSENGAFNNPTLVAFNAGYVFVKDTGNNRVQQFTEAGDFVNSYTTGTALNLSAVKQVRYDKLGNMYLLLNTKHQVIKLNAYGGYEFTIGKADGTPGSGDGQFNDPVSLCVDDEGFVYVADKGNKRVQIFTSKGEYMQQIVSGGMLESMEFISCKLDSLGKLDKLIVVDNSGTNKIVRIYNNLGNVISSITTGTIKILAAYIDGFNRLVLALDATTSTIKIYNLDASYAVTPNISTPFKTIDGNTEFKPIDLTLDATSNLIIANSLGKNVYFIKNDASVAANIAYQKNWGVPTAATGDYNGLFVPTGTMLSASINRNDGTMVVTTSTHLHTTKLPEVITLPDVVLDITNDTNGNPYALIGTSSRSLYKIGKDLQVTSMLTGIDPKTHSLFIDHEGNYIICKDPNSTTSSIQLLNPSGEVIKAIDGTNTLLSAAIELDQRGRLYRGFVQTGSPDSYRFTRNNLPAAIDYLFAGYLNGLSITGILNLKKTFDSERGGKDSLAYFYLTPKEFNYIIELLHLVLLTGDIAQTDWDQLYDILLMAYKRKQLYKDWLKEENNTAGGASNYDVFLSPYDFKLLTTSEENNVVLIPWRADFKARKSWRKLLSSRTDAIDTLRATFESQFGDVEEDGLKLLRDKIIADGNTKIPASVPAGNKTDWLSERLFIDMAGNCCTRNPRVSHYIEILQNIFNRVRTGSLEQLDPTTTSPAYTSVLDMRISDPKFENSWATLRSYATWRSAMFVNFYPENLLIPSLRKEKTRFFSSLASNVASSERFNPEQACVVAKQYSDYLKDVSYLTPSTSLYTQIGMNDNRLTAVDRAVKADVIMHFAQSPYSRKVYYAITDLGKVAEQRTAEWIELEQLTYVEYILGAAEIFDEKDRQPKIVLLVKRTTETNVAEIAMLVYSTSDGTWSDDTESLDLEHNISAADYPYLNVGGVQLPFDNGGMQAIMEEAPVAGFKYKDRLDWNSFITSGSSAGIPRVPAIALSIYWSTFVLICFLDFKNKKLVSRSGPVFVRGAGEVQPDKTIVYKTPHPINTPSTLNFVPSALVRFPDNSVTYASGKFALIGTDRGLDWEKSVPTVFYLNKHGERITNMSSADISVGFAGYWFDQDADRLHTFWQNGQAYVGRYIQNGLNNDSYFANTKNGFIRSITNAPASNAGALNRNTVITMAEDGQLRFGLPGYSGAGEGRWLYLRTNLMALNATLFSSPYIVNPIVDKSDLLNLINGTRNSLKSDRNNTLISKTYIAEAYYFVPMILADQLQKKGYYKEALDWFKLLYNYTMAMSSRKIYYGLVAEEQVTANIDRPENWLSDPFNPHALALLRNNAYTKYTVSAIVRCLLAYADNEFTKDTIESVGLARMLYQQAKTLIYESGILGSNLDSQCAAKIAYVDTFDTHASFTGSNAIWFGQWQAVKAKLHMVTSLTNLTALCNPAAGSPPGFIATTLASGSTTKVKLSQISQKIDQYIMQSTTLWSLSSLVAQNRSTREQVHKQLLRDLETVAKMREQVVALASAKAKAFTQVTGITESAMRTGVSISLNGSPSPTIVPIRMEILRQPPVTISVSISRVITSTISL